MIQYVREFFSGTNDDRIQGFRMQTAAHLIRDERLFSKPLVQSEDNPSPFFWSGNRRQAPGHRDSSSSLRSGAVMHGVANRIDGGTVSIESRRDGDCLRIVISDTGPGFAVTDQESSGVGLANTSARLYQLFGDSCKLSFGQAQKGGASVSISIPFNASDYTRRRIPA